jgi:MOSC domain-containing protein YiiM
MSMKIISVNVGLPREFAWNGTSVSTAIFKEPVSGPVPMKQLNLDGDRQADLTVHGGRYKAVYGYPSEHYEYWRGDLPQQALLWGVFGENLTTEGLFEDSLFIGDRVKVGSAVLQVTQPRLPCYKLTIRFDRDDMIKRFLHSRRSGFYFSVVEEGEVQAGSTIQIVSRDPNQMSVADISNLYFAKDPDPQLLQRAAGVTALPPAWREDFLAKLQSRKIS